eukprot:GHRQ01034754.1.p1 GENE.GHRQ01034754.1~~GHRQ01034754.1.p1  ORF type:complete len:167 (-),score=39.94 GHRQ01034754.1:226-726(-)
MHGMPFGIRCCGGVYASGCRVHAHVNPPLSNSAWRTPLTTLHHTTPTHSRPYCLCWHLCVHGPQHTVGRYRLKVPSPCFFQQTFFMFAVQVSRAQQLLACYRAVAALRSDEVFQEDASQPSVQAALREMALTNSFEKYVQGWLSQLLEAACSLVLVAVPMLSCVSA